MIINKFGSPFLSFQRKMFKKKETRVKIYFSNNQYLNNILNIPLQNLKHFRPSKKRVKELFPDAESADIKRFTKQISNADELVLI